MFKSFLTLFLAGLSLLAPLQGISQCGDPNIRDGFAPTTDMHVYVVVHVIRDNAGNGPSLAAVQDMTTRAYNDFRGITMDNYLATCTGPTCPTTPACAAAPPSGACVAPAVPYPTDWTVPGAMDTRINLCFDIRLHNNTSWVYADPFSFFSTLLAMPGTPSTTQAVHVIVNEFTIGPFSGSFTPAYMAGIFVKVGYNSCSSLSRDLSHELGHYFNLGHPQDLRCDEFYLTNCCDRNFVSDGFSDTDPDPNLATYPSGGPLGNYCDPTSILPSYLTDACIIGSPLPLTLTTRFNIMQYGAGGCAVSFTPQQGRKMRCYISSSLSSLLAFASTAGIPAGCPLPCEADFTASPVNTCPGSPVSFTDQSIDPSGITSWLWDFGDGIGTSTLPNPSYSYLTPGTYTVTLTITCTGGGSSTRTRSAYINVLSSGFTLPYFQNFDTRMFPHPGWEEANNGIPGGSNPHFLRTEGGVFVGTGGCGSSIITSGYPWYRCTGSVIGMPDSFSVRCMSPTGYTYNTTESVPNGCVSTFYGATGAVSELISPFFDLTSVSNPVVSFHISHNPSGGAGLGPCDCDFNYPGFPPGWDLGAGATNTCYWSSPGQAACDCDAPGPACASLTPSPANCPDSPTLNFYASTDCGASWFVIWSATGAALNTVLGHDCTPFSFFPLTAGVWRQEMVNLCSMTGNAFIRFKFEFIQQRYTGSIFIDDFYVGPAPGAPVLSSANVIKDDCGLCTGIIQAAAGGGTPPYSYTLQQIGGSSTGPNTTGLFNGLCTGSYLLILSDAAGNCAQMPVTVGNSPSIAITHTITDEVCTSGNGAVTLYNPSAASPFTYELCAPGGSPCSPPSGPTTAGSWTFTGLSAGTYEYTVTDAASNCAIGTVTVGTSTNLSVSASTSYDCVAGSGCVSISSPLSSGSTVYTYQVTSLPPLLPFTLSGAGTTFCGLAQGDYEIYVSDGAGNCGITTVTVAAGSPLALSVTYPGCGVVYGNADIAVTGGSGPYNYAVSEITGSVPVPVTSGTSATSPVSLTGLPPGFYEIQINNGGANCGSVSFTITGTFLTGSDIVQGTACGGCTGEIHISLDPPAAGPFTVTVVPTPSYPPTVSGTDIDMYFLCAGTYAVTIEDASGSCFVQSYTIANSTPGFSYTTTITPANWCASDGSIEVCMSGTGPYNVFLFQPPSLVPVVSAMSVSGPCHTFTGLPSGPYDVAAVDASPSCIYFTATVPNTGAPAVSAGPDQSICTGGTVTLSGTTTYSGGIVNWYDPLGSSVGTGLTLTFTPTLPGNYTVQITDPGSGCSVSDVVQVDIYNCCAPAADILVLPLSGGSPLSSSLGAVPSGSTLYIHDELIVDNTFSLLNCDLIFNTDAKITVTAGGHIDFNVCNLYSCGNMWEGLIADVSSFSAGIHMTECTLRDAITGITHTPGTPFSLRLEANTFSLNHKHVVIDNNMGPMYFLANQFLGGNIALSPWAGSIPETAIEVNNTDDCMIGDPAAGWVNRNVFDGTVKGIHSYRSAIIVRSNEFRNHPGTAATLTGIGILIDEPATGGNISKIGGVPLSSGFTEINTFFQDNFGVVARNHVPVYIRGNRFEKLGETAIFLDQLSGSYAEVFENSISGWLTGVRAISVSGAFWSIHHNQYASASTHPVSQGISLVSCQSDNTDRIHHNTIQVGGNGIEIELSSALGVYANNIENTGIAVAASDVHGIKVDQSVQVRLGKNILTDSYVGVWLSIAYGIKCTDMEQSEVYCNDVTKYMRSLAFEGDCNPTAVHHNVMRAGKLGIVLQNCGQVGPQGASGAPTMNRWLNPGWVHKMASIGSGGTLSSPWYIRTAGVPPQYNPGTPGLLAGGICPPSAIGLVNSPSGGWPDNYCSLLPAKTTEDGGYEPQYEEHAFMLNAFPNPTSGVVTIRVESSDVLDVTIRIINSVGHVVWESAPDTGSMLDFEADLSNFSAGMYMVRAESGTEVQTQKLILIH